MKQNVDVSILMGSDSDLAIFADAASILEEFGISFEINVLSAHRTPKALLGYLHTLTGKETKVVIAGAGGAAHLPGVVAAHVYIPVIGLPIKTPTLQGVDSLYSIVQMPPGVPVATVGINAAKNAALLAIQILSVSDKDLKKKLIAYKEKLAKGVVEKNLKLQKLGYKKYLEK